MNILQKLINAKVVTFIPNEEEICIEFSNGAKVNIFNQNSITPINSNLTGSTLTNVIEDKSTLTFTFNHFISLTVSLENEAYNGPEALSYIDPAGHITVWN